MSQWFVRISDQIWICSNCRIKRCWGIGYRPREEAIEGYLPLLQCRGSCGGPTRHEYVGMATALDATNSWDWARPANPEIHNSAP